MFPMSSTKGYNSPASSAETMLSASSTPLRILGVRKEAFRRLQKDSEGAQLHHVLLGHQNAHGVANLQIHGAPIDGFQVIPVVSLTCLGNRIQKSYSIVVRESVRHAIEAITKGLRHLTSLHRCQSRASSDVAYSAGAGGSLRTTPRLSPSAKTAVTSSTPPSTRINSRKQLSQVE